MTERILSMIKQLKEKAASLSLDASIKAYRKDSSYWREKEKEYDEIYEMLEDLERRVKEGKIGEEEVIKMLEDIKKRLDELDEEDD